VQPEELFGFQVLFAFEQQPARLLEHRHAALACHAARFSGADFVKRLVHFRHDVKTIEDVKRHSRSIRTLRANLTLGRFGMRPECLVQLRRPEQNVSQAAAYTFRFQSLFAHRVVRRQRIHDRIQQLIGQIW
jgi:hypothetical protein